MEIGQLYEKLYWKNPVKYNGATYTVTALIERVDEKRQPVIQLELLDKNNHSVVIARLEDVEAC